jgi:TPR repeat protein
MQKLSIPVMALAVLLASYPAAAQMPDILAPGQASLETGRAAYNNRDWNTAVINLRPLSENGDPAASVLLGNMYVEGYGVGQDEAEAFKLFRRAAIKNHPDGILTVASMYQAGIGVPQNIKYAVQWFERGARLGQSTSAYFYALYLVRGNKSEAFDLKPDNEAAYKWLRIGARNAGKVELQTAMIAMAEKVSSALPPGTLAKLDLEIKNWQPPAISDLAPFPEDIPDDVTTKSENSPEQTLPQ